MIQFISIDEWTKIGPSITHSNIFNSETCSSVWHDFNSVFIVLGYCALVVENCRIIFKNKLANGHLRSIHYNPKSNFISDSVICYVVPVKLYTLANEDFLVFGYRSENLIIGRYNYFNNWKKRKWKLVTLSTSSFTWTTLSLTYRINLRIKSKLSWI